MSYEGWICLGGLEVVNQDRTVAYSRNRDEEACEGGGDCFPIAENCGTCPTIHTGDVYVSPATDPAPWYDAGVPESADFHGLLVTSVTGLGPGKVTRALEGRSSGVGSVLGRITQASPTVTVSGVLLGTSCAGTDYGKRWLSGMLAGACGEKARCSGEDMVFYTSCPTEPEDSPAEPSVNMVANSSWELPVTFGESGDVEGNPPEALSVVGPVGDAFEGTHYLSLDNVTGVPTPNLQCEDATYAECGPGDVLTASGYFRFGAGTATWRIRLDVQFFDETDTPIAAVQGAITVPPVAWTRLTNTTTPAPAGTTHALIRVRMTSAALGDEMHVDALQLQQGAVATDWEPAETPSESPGEAFAGFSRTIKGATLVSGVEVVETIENEGCPCPLEKVEFQIAASWPCMYTPTATLDTEVPFVPLMYEDPTCRFHWISCPEGPRDCNDPNLCIADPNCPPPRKPPKAPPVRNPCTCAPWWPAMGCTDIDALDLPDHAQGIPIIRIRSGADELKHVSIRIYQNPLGLAPELLDPCAACGAVLLSRIPPMSEFVMDGTDRSVTILCPGNSPTDASPLLAQAGGRLPFSWPIIECGTVTYTVCVEVDAETLDEDGASFDVSLAAMEC